MKRYEMKVVSCVRGKLLMGGTDCEEDADVVIVVPDIEAHFGRRMYNKKTGEEIPFGIYPNIDWS
jgi:hypothetical protein